jgi:ferredoxin-NADP reductase
MTKIPVRFLKKEHLSTNTSSFYFDRANIPFDFFPGQYIKLTLITKEGKEISRFFTISSSPLEKNYLRITSKKGESDFKKVLFDLQQNQPVTIFGPLGGFFLKDNETNEHVFLAGGIGMTPFLSMIAYATEKKLPIPITLFVFFKTEKEMIFYDELQEFAQKNTFLKIIYTLTQPNKNWLGETGRISAEMIKKYIPDLMKPTYSIVGSSKMIEETEDVLYELNISEEKIKIENFTGYE